VSRGRQDKAEDDQARIFVQPIEGAKRIHTGYKTVDVTRPVYKTVKKKVPKRVVVGHKWVWVTERSKDDPYGPVGRKRVRQPIYGTRGYEIKEVRVRDGDKTHVVQEKRPVYQKTDPLDYYSRWLEAQNALALYTLLRCGEPVDSDRVKQAAQWLLDGAIEEHRLPDATADQAAMILALAPLPDEDFRKLARQLIEKLLVGQIRAGDPRGMWGTYALDVDGLTELQKNEMQGVLIREKLANQLRTYKQTAARGRREKAGRANVRRKYGAVIDKARAAVLRHLLAYGRRGVEPKVPVCTQFDLPYYAFTLATAMDDPALLEPTLGLIPEGLLCRLLFSQENDGSWPKKPTFSFGTTKFNRLFMGRRWRRGSNFEHAFGHQVVNTVFAALLLAETARPVAAAHWDWSDRGMPNDTPLDGLCAALTKDTGLRVRWRLTPAELPDGLAGFAPALLVTPDAKPKRRLAR
jgi:hypothetical protein